MCGLAGFLLSAENDSKIIGSQLKSMTDAITHRGPDDEGFWTQPSERVAIGHRRLSILDLTFAGHQPMLSHSKRYVIAFNGEIYNHLELRGKLEIDSENELNWNGHSDTETLLQCFDLWGIDRSLERIKGMFAIAIYDTIDKALYLIRDRMGEKPVYYGWINNNFVFGSEIKSIKQFNGFQGEIDRDSLALFLKYDYIPEPYSIFKGINKLQQGNYLKIKMSDRGWTQQCKVSIKQYWSMEEVVNSGANKKFIGTDEQAIEKLEELISESVKQQMISDVPLGAFLSGGIDSSLAVAMMQKQSSRKVKTFTIGFDEKNYNEAEYAKQVASHIGTDHTELYITPKQAMAVISKLPKIYDEPFADSSQIPMFLVSEMARKHVTVSLSGDGADELFGGYNRYFMANKLWKRLNNIPLFIRKLISQSIGFFNPRIWNFIFIVTYKFLPKKFMVSNPTDKVYKFSRILTSRDIYEVYDRLISHWINPYEVVLNSKNKEIKSNFSSLSPEEEMMLSDSLSYLPDDILVKVDRASMFVSLETRAPFLDKDIVEFACQIPLNLKIRDSKGKWILRKILDKYVPNDLIDRPKMGFGVPIDSWLRGPLKDWAEDLLNEKRLTDDGYFNVKLIRKKWNEHLSGDQNWQYHLWSILMFQVWLDEQ
jgi:asparagine synthase (glutamine-hydrolysing)